MTSPDPASTLAKPPAERTVKSVVLGDLLFKTWYQSIYPEELVNKEADRLYVCRWCFRYSDDAAHYAKHARICETRTAPPGAKVYGHGGYSVWEVDGEEQKLYSQNLSLFAKLFLDHKSVFFDVASFLYYILTFTDSDDPETYHTLGYFSKEKLSWDANNLACILIFPPFQHKSLGKLLMGVSYKLSGWEWEGGFIGGPERPLSELGRKSYTRFWNERVARYLLAGAHQEEVNGAGDQRKSNGARSSRKRTARESMTVQQIGRATGMLPEDVATALQGMGVVEPDNTRKRRRVDRSSSAEDGSLAQGDSVVIRKSNVLAWAKLHRMPIRDPVRNEGFIGEWAFDPALERPGTDGSDEQDG